VQYNERNITKMTHKLLLLAVTRTRESC